MPMNDAREFIFDAMRDDRLRNAVNTAPDAAAREDVLADRGYRFTPDEFDDAWRSELTQCQTEALADRLHDVGQWWRLVVRMV